MIYYPDCGMLDDYQISYCGLTMGNGTPWDIAPPADLLGLQSVRPMEQARAYGAGSWAGPDYADVATLSIPVELAADTDDAFTQQAALFTQAFSVKSAPVPLWVKVPGFPQYCIACTMSKRPMPMDSTYGRYMAATLELRAAHPAKQGIPRMLRLATFGSGAASAGLRFPLFAAPGHVMDFGPVPQSPNNGIVATSGTAPAFPQALISITASASYIELLVGGQEIRFVYPLRPGDRLVFDWADGSATLNGSDRSLNLACSGFAPVTGASVALLVSDGQATCEITYADRWDGEGL